jgi:hypothetical protein
MLLGLGAEPLSGVRAIAERCAAPRTVVPIGYVDQVHAYLPTDADLPGDGYEVSGFRTAFAMQGSYHPGIDAAVERGIRRTMQPEEGKIRERG